MDQSSRALEIGEVYRAAQASQQASVRALHACGVGLAEVKASLPHGTWLLWIKDHQELLGFSISTAQRLVRLANEALAPHLTEADAVQVSRRVWSHEIELAAATPAEFSGHYRRISGFVEWLEKHAVSEVPDAELMELRPRVERIRRWLEEFDGKARRMNLRLSA